MSQSQQDSVEQILGDFAEAIINYDKRMEAAGAPPIRFVHKYVKEAAAKLQQLIEKAKTAPPKQPPIHRTIDGVEVTIDREVLDELGIEQPDGEKQ